MDHFLQDLKYAFRMLGKSPTFTVLAVLALGLGIGANTTIFSLANALLFQSLPVKEPNRLVAIYTTDKKVQGFNGLSHLNWKDYRQELTAFEGILGYDWTPMSVSTGAEPRFTFGQLVSGNYFDVLGIRAAYGRTLRPEDDEVPGRDAVTVLSWSYWQKHMGGDPSAVGRSITVNAVPFTVVGIAPESFTGTDTGIRPELWVPMAMNKLLKTTEASNWYEQRRGLFVNTIGRLRPDATPVAAQALANTVAARLEQEYPNDNKGRGVTLVPLRQAGINPQAREVVVMGTALLMVIVGLVLLIACANVANLLLARAIARRKEIAVRLAIGASRGRLVRQLLTESVLLAVPGALLGLVVAAWARQGLLGFLPNLPFPITVALPLDIDLRVLAFTVVVALGTGFLFGLIPALLASRPELVEALKDQGELQPGGHRRFAARNLLVAGQVALSLVALIGAALFVRSLGAAQKTDPGFETKNLLSLSFDVGLSAYDQARGEAFFRQVVERVATLPGVASAAVATGGPLQGTLSRSIFLEGGDENDRTLVPVNTVGPHYFETLGIPIVKGRAFTDDDRAGSTKVVIVNETMAKKMWPDRDPIGKRFRFFSDPTLSEVVGVAKDVKYFFLGEDPQPYVYEVLAQRYNSGLTLVARTATAPGPLMETVRREVVGFDKDLPIVGLQTVQKTLYDSLWAARMGGSLLAIFGLLALVLASVGIYGVTSYTVGQRQREIGIRVALGARRRDVLSLVIRQGMGVVAFGLAAGLALAFALARLVEGLLFGVSATDVLSFGGTAVLLAAVALVANFFPARRASSTDATAALRYR
jgi:macrolide transport system ATP-binding/permease protein